MNQKRIDVESEIILNLINRESHGREMSKNIGIPLSTVQRALSRMEKIGVLASRQMGKNKLYSISKNLAAKKRVFDAENYKLLRLVEKYPFLEPLIEDISKKCSCPLVILFGSFAKFTAKPDSDIDIFIETSELKEKMKIEELNSRISLKIGSFNKESLLAKEIMKNHIIIKGVEYYYEKTGFFG